MTKWLILSRSKWASSCDMTCRQNRMKDVIGNRTIEFIWDFTPATFPASEDFNKFYINYAASLNKNFMNNDSWSVCTIVIYIVYSNAFGAGIDLLLFNETYYLHHWLLKNNLDCYDWALSKLCLPFSRSSDRVHQFRNRSAYNLPFLLSWVLPSFWTFPRYPSTFLLIFKYAPENFSVDHTLCIFFPLEFGILIWMPPDVVI